MSSTNGVVGIGELGSSKAPSRIAASKSGLDRSATGSGALASSRSIQAATSNDTVSVNSSSKGTPEKRSSPACGNGESSPRKVLRRRVGAGTAKNEEEDDDDQDSEAVTQADEMNDGVVEDSDNNYATDTVCEDVSVAVTGKKNAMRGKVWRARNGDYIRYLCIDDGSDYRPGDAAYIESQGADQPFFICTIQEFRRSKRDTLMVNIKWYYRPCEVPETVYQLLVQDRNTEQGNKISFLHDPVIKGRELFISDATDTYPVSLLRGVCRVQHFTDIQGAEKFLPSKDSFFYILGYNPETRRLASTQGEIRVGPSHQARLPELRAQLGLDKRPEKCEDWEEPRWVPPPNAPGVRDGDLIVYIQAARSVAAFVGMCDGGSPDDGCLAASRDDTTINAMDVLHNSGYDLGKALQTLAKCPVPKGIDKKWSEDETKRFVKGLRQYGKNFFRIRKDLLPHKDTSDLVEFYYLWKKTPAAANQRPHRRRHRQSVLRRIRTTRNTRAAKEEPGDLSSASEDDNSDDDSDSRDLAAYHCRHCFSTSSKDWHHAGKDKALLCTDCRVHFKKYGELPLLKTTQQAQGSESEARSEPPYMFRPVQNPDDEEVEGRVRTRTRTKELMGVQNARNRPKQDSGNNSPEPEGNERRSHRKSPSSASNCSSSSSSVVHEKDKGNNGNKAKSMVESPSKGHKRRHGGGGAAGTAASGAGGGTGGDVPGPDREPTGNGNEDERGPPRQKKKKKNDTNSESPSESVSSESSSLEDNGIDGLDGDVDQDLEPSETRSAGSGSAGGGSRTSSPEVPAGKSADAAAANPSTGENAGSSAAENNTAAQAAALTHPTSSSSSSVGATPAGATAPSSGLANGTVGSGEGTPDEKERSESPSQAPTSSASSSSSSSSMSALPRPFEPVKAGQSDDLPPMVKLEPDFNPTATTTSANEDVKSRPAGALLSPASQDRCNASAAEANKTAPPVLPWMGKEEIGPAASGFAPSSPKLPSPTASSSSSSSSSSCPPPLDMSIAAAAEAANAALRNSSASSSASGLHSSPFMVPPAHSGFVRPYAPLEPAVPGALEAVPYSSLAPPSLAPAPATGGPLGPLGPLPAAPGSSRPDMPEQSEPHNLKIKQEMAADPATSGAAPAPLRDVASSIPRDPSLPTLGAGFASYPPPPVIPTLPLPPSSSSSLVEPKREPGLSHPHPTTSPRPEKSSSSSSGIGLSTPGNSSGGSSASGGSKSAVKKPSTPTPQQQQQQSSATQPQQSQPPAPPPPAHSLPYPPHFLPPGLGLGPPQGLPMSPYHQPGAHAYSPYYPYPFAYHYPPMRMHAPPPPPSSAASSSSSGPRPPSPPSFGAASAGFPPTSMAGYHPGSLGLGNFHASSSVAGGNPFAPSVSGSNGNGPSMHPSPPVTTVSASSSSLSTSSSSSVSSALGGRPFSNKAPSDPSQLGAAQPRGRSPPPSSSSSSQKRAASPLSKRSHHPTSTPMPAHSMPSSSSPYLPIFSSASSAAGLGGVGVGGYPPTSASIPTYSAVGPGPFGFGGGPSLAELQAKSESPWNPHPHHPHALSLPLSHPHHHLQPRSSTPIQPMASTSALSHPAAGLSLAPVSPTVGNHLMAGLVPPPSASSSSSSASAAAALAHDEANSTIHEDMEEEAPSPVANTIPRGPSPEPRIEDSECHRSQSAIFLRHWNRGEGSSCARTDLTFKPVPDSKLARRREERLRRQAERDRDEREKEKERERAAAHARKAATPDKRETPKPSTSGAGPIETITSPGFDRFGPRSYPDTPALRQLSEYARPHTGFSPGGMQRNVPGGLGIGPPAMDPMLHYQLASMYGAGARERLELELEREKRERELRELREREISDRFKEEMLKNGAGLPPGMGMPGGPGGLGPRLSGPLDPHWLELHRRYAGIPGGPPPGAGLGPPPGFGLYQLGGNPGGGAGLNPLERERLERLGLQLPGGMGGPMSGPPGSGGGGGGGGPGDPRSQEAQARDHQAAVDRLQAERIHAAMADQLRLQMAGQDMPPPGFPLNAGYPRPPPGMLHQDSALGLHPAAAAAMLGRPYDEQFARQFAAEQQLQRQMMEQRFPHPGAPPSGPPSGPSLHPHAHPNIVAQHEEYIRQQQQREREMKVRAIEEAARGGRP